MFRLGSGKNTLSTSKSEIGNLRYDTKTDIEFGLQTLFAWDSRSRSNLELRAALDEFVNSQNDRGNALFVIGNGGLGKSSEVLWLIQKTVQELHNNIAAYRNYDQPQDYIPVYVQLRRFRISQELPSKYIISTLKGTEYDRHADFEKILTDRELKFLVVLDAVDEIAKEEWSPSIDAIVKLLRDYPQPKFVVVTRPHIFPKKILDGYQCLFVKPLTPVQVVSRVKAAEVSENVKTKLIILIQTDPQLQQLLAVPRMLTASINSLAGRQNISLGMVIRAAIEEHIKTDIDKLGGPILLEIFVVSLMNLLRASGVTTRFILAKQNL